MILVSKKVELFIDDVKVKEFTSSPYKYDWDVSGYDDNSEHTIYAKAYDNAGNVGTSKVVTVVKVPFAPVFIDKFEDSVNTTSTLFSSFYSETVNGTRNISFVDGIEGKAVHLDELNSYVGYSSQCINPTEGTIRFYFKPDADMYTVYNDPNLGYPHQGFLIDTVGWLYAYTGAFGFSLLFRGGNITNMAYGTWNSSDWSTANSNPDYSDTNNFVFESDKFYDIAITWNKTQGKLRIYIDGVLKAEADYNADLNNTYQFFIGHNPFQNYWPYEARSLRGTYDELKVYDKDIFSD
ncbi:MAG: hypothetical protein CBR30_06325 [Dictyoglomus sp. NZ13-RE01]|nr:MAG: hypothetical protein CBR30_06325 [Dictyoglomus sp. NZ13-RE01]